ncbi:MAG: SRPBCC domain-containing protein [Sphingomicrobium sp.]
MKWAIALALLAVPAAAQAELVGSAANGLEVRHVVQIVMPPERTFDAFTHISQWWNKEHTYSGDSANLSLSTTPGGCFCERFPNGGGIEHLHVAYVEPGERLVLTGSLGPLLYLATSGVMDIRVERIAGGSRLTLDYRVAGFAGGGADKLAPQVDQMLGDQLARFRKYAAATPQTR